MNYKYPTTPYQDYKVPASPAMRELVSKQVEKHDPDDPIGFAHLAEMVKWSDQESTIKYETDDAARIIKSRPPFVYHGGWHPRVPEHSRRGESEIHPLVGEIAKTKLIQHGETISDNPHRLLSHLAKLSSVLGEYRSGWSRDRDFEQYIDPSARLNYNRFPKHEQQMIANQYMRALSHPAFRDNLEEYGKMLSLNETGYMHHANPMMKGTFNEMHGALDWHLPNNVLHDPSVRHSMHDFLDSFEKQGEHHALVAARVRSRMLGHNNIQAPEIIRMAHKFADNPKAFEFGSHGIVRGNEKAPFVTETTQKDVITSDQAEKIHAPMRAQNPNYRIPWLLRPESEQNQHLKFLKEITKAISVNPGHTRESYLDAASTVVHLINNHPSYRHMRGNPQESSHSVVNYNALPTINGHIDLIHRGMQQIIDADNRRAGIQRTPYRNPDEGKELIEARAKMKASGVLR